MTHGFFKWAQTFDFGCWLVKHDLPALPSTPLLPLWSHSPACHLAEPWSRQGHGGDSDINPSFCVNLLRGKCFGDMGREVGYNRWGAMGCQGPSIQSSSLDGNEKWAILDITNQHQGAIVAQYLEGFWAAFRRITTIEVHEHTNCCLGMWFFTVLEALQTIFFSGFPHIMFLQLCCSLFRGAGKELKTAW